MKDNQKEEEERYLCVCGVEPKQRDTLRVINYPAQVSSSLLIDFTTHRWSLFPCCGKESLLLLVVKYFEEDWFSFVCLYA